MVLWKDETAAGQTYKYVWVSKVHSGIDGKIRSADVEYKIPGESKFRVLTIPIHKLMLIVPWRSRRWRDLQTWEEGH
jgi:hypothetical protein